MTARAYQNILAAVFFGLGGWCLVLPGTVEHLVFKPEFQHMSLTSKILVGCFGAQAVLAGTLIALTKFTSTTFLVFGVAGSLPFFAFNYYFYFVAEVFTEWMLLDFVGNIAILSLCILGYMALKKTE